MESTSTKALNYPLITLAIRHFNNAPFVEPALRGAFAQTYKPLEILFIDDCSTDRGFAIAERLAADYAGPHRLVLFRNEKNLGPGGQIMRVREFAKGDIIVFADADDISLPERCQRVWEAFQTPDALAVTSHFDFIDAAGEWMKSPEFRFSESRYEAEHASAEDIASGRYGATTGAVLAIRRSVLERGVRLDNLRRGEDQVCGFRCVLLGRVVSIPEVLVHRRVHKSNLTAPVHDNLTLDEVRRQYFISTREAVLVPGAMRRDLIQLVREGTISESRARPLLSALAAHARKLKILRVSERLPVLRRWACLCDLHGLGISYRTSIRMLLPVLAPRLESLRKHRQGRLFAVAFRDQSMRSGLPIR